MAFNHYYPVKGAMAVRFLVGNSLVAVEASMKNQAIPAIDVDRGSTELIR